MGSVQTMADAEVKWFRTAHVGNKIARIASGGVLNGAYSTVKCSCTYICNAIPIWNGYLNILWNWITLFVSRIVYLSYFLNLRILTTYKRFVPNLFVLAYLYRTPRIISQTLNTPVLLGLNLIYFIGYFNAQEQPQCTQVTNTCCIMRYHTTSGSKGDNIRYV